MSVQMTCRRAVSDKHNSYAVSEDIRRVAEKILEDGCQLETLRIVLMRTRGVLVVHAYGTKTKEKQ